MNFSISNYYVYGLERAVKASGNPMRTKIDTSEATDKDFLRAAKLGSCQGGEGHDNYLKGINVQLDVSAPLYWWKQFDTYKVGTVAQSESTMHTLLKRPITRKSFEQGEKIPILWVWYLERLRRKKDFTRLNLFLPNSWLQRRIVTLNYEVINNIIRQRYHHKLPEWQYFCERIWKDADCQALIVQKEDLNSKCE